MSYDFNGIVMVYILKGKTENGIEYNGILSSSNNGISTPLDEWKHIP